MASGTMNIMQNIGQVIGISICAGMLGGGATDAVGFQQWTSQAFMVLAS